MAVNEKYDPNKGYKQSQDVISAYNKMAGANAMYDSLVANGFHTSNETNWAYGDLTKAEEAYNKHYANGFTYANETDYQTAMKNYLNREKFSYDLNGDALYQQYKDKYIQQGKMAMADTMGQAAAMTGGYGSSYAASVGNQAYQASLQQLNDIIPELYQMAYDRYTQEGQELYNKYTMYDNDRTTAYGMWSAEGERLGNNRTYASDQYNTFYGRDYTEWNDKVNRADSERKYHTDNYYNTYGIDYGEYRDSVSDAQFNETMDFNKAQANKSTPVAFTPAEYETFRANLETEAGKGKDAFDSYLRGYMSRGYLSEAEANNIRQQYFPTELPNRKMDGSRMRGNGIEYTMN